MIYLQLNAINKTYDQDHLLKDVSLSVVKGDRIGLIGPNGAGKTTLLQIALGEILPDSGLVTTGNQVKIGYVSQQDELSSGYPLFMAMIESYQELLTVWDEMEKLEVQIPAGDKKILEKYGELQQKWEFLGGYSYEADIKSTLIGLGFSENDFHRPISTLSGGERNRASLAKILLHSPDLLLLDEPTNHLDIESTVWLENYLKVFNGALVVVSHDRIFLDNIVNKIVELDNGYLETYHSNFSKFYEERTERRRLQLKKYLAQKEEIERIEDFIRRNIVGQKTRQAQSRRLSLSKMKRLQVPTSDPKTMSVNVQLSRRSYQSVLEVRNLSFSYGERQLLDNINFQIERGESVGLIGRNGIGKSTLVRLLAGELQLQSGNVNIGRNVDWRYFDQELSDLDPEETVINTVWDVRPDFVAFQLRSHLARFLFFGEDVFKQVKMLSGGEKKKLALARLLATPANFLILDEPTNHLDIDSREVLEESLIEYQGAVLFISHDRYFLDTVARRILALEDGRLYDVPGNYSYYAAQKESSEQKTKPPDKIKKRDEYKQLKREKNIQSMRKKRKKELKIKIAETDKRITALTEELQSNTNASDWEKLQRLQAEKDQQQDMLEKITTEYLKLLEEDEADYI